MKKLKRARRIVYGAPLRAIELPSRCECMQVFRLNASRCALVLSVGEGKMFEPIQSQWEIVGRGVRMCRLPHYERPLATHKCSTTKTSEPQTTPKPPHGRSAPPSTTPHSFPPLSNELSFATQTPTTRNTTNKSLSKHVHRPLHRHRSPFAHPNITRAVFVDNVRLFLDKATHTLCVCACGRSVVSWPRIEEKPSCVTRPGAL